MARMAKMRSCRLQDPDAGFVSDATNLVEYPQLVADRILRYAAIVGRENVVAGTDCGRGGRIHADLVWAKLRTLVDRARFASTSLWPWLNLLATVAEFRYRLSRVYSVADDAAYSLPSRSWIRPARRWRVTEMPTWFGRSFGHAR